MSVRWPRFLTPSQLSQIIQKQKNPLVALQLFKEAKEKYPDYHHNGPVYASMIGILGNSGRVNEMKEVIDQMKEDSCELKDSVAATAIKIYGGNGLLNEALSLFKNLPQFNCVNWTKSFNTLLQLMVKESKLETAHRLFLENSFGWEVKSRLRALNLLMDALCHRNQSDLALQIFQEMNYQGCYPDRESYQILMKGLCKDGRLHEATHLLYSMFCRISQKGSGADIVIYRTVLDALCDDGQVEMAAEILSKILRKGLKAPKRCQYNLDLTRFSSVEDVQETKRLINETLIRGGIPSLASYTAMAVDLYGEGNICQGDKVLHEMRARGFQTTTLTYEAKMVALCREGRVDEAMNVLEVEMVEQSCAPTVRLYNTVIKGLCDSGNSAMAVGYLKKMAKQVGCVADNETYRILAEGLCQDGRYLEASQILDEMMIKSYCPSGDTYRLLIKGLCSIGRQYEAVMWLEEMLSRGKLPEVSVWEPLVSSALHNMAVIDVAVRHFLLLSSS
ncbi:pentatricopeptide repeat-containing family protein [Tripterygium wilfordii]|uniref:Pentatricopeptide repeat-containing family protein n=1 Tax=Tripterygium wilfordii TaxID=458696 RepID=A0A7J7CGT8_TRIWF|nr:pentatricopeptide repeat-containing protein At1g05600 [Tripterygium wilfordii]KAF5733265.1 pentatricopeptide repeat-containing family protein [Tripterygium wilfordii]